MTRRKAKRRDWRVVVFLVLSVLIVLAMILAMFLPSVFTPS